MSNESDRKIFVVDQDRLSSLSGAARACGVSDKSSKLPRFVPERNIQHGQVLIRRVRADRVAIFYIGSACGILKRVSCQVSVR